MKAIYWKELRDHRWLALISLIIVSLFWFVVTMLSGEMTIPITSPEMLMGNLLAPAIAVLLGIGTLKGEQSADRRAFLSHRPIGLPEIFAAKVLAGMTWYAMAVAGPFLVTAVNCSRHTYLISPFHWKMAIPAILHLIGGLWYFFAGMIIAVEPRRSLIRRILILSPVTLTVVLIFKNPPGLAVPIILFAGVALLYFLAAWFSFREHFSAISTHTVYCWTLGAAALPGLFGFCIVLFHALVSLSTQEPVGENFIRYQLGTNGALYWVRFLNRSPKVYDFGGKEARESVLAPEVAFRQVLFRPSIFDWQSQFLTVAQNDQSRSNNIVIWMYSRYSHELFATDFTSKKRLRTLDLSDLGELGWNGPIHHWTLLAASERGLYSVNMQDGKIARILNNDASPILFAAAPDVIRLAPTPGVPVVGDVETSGDRLEPTLGAVVATKESLYFVRRDGKILGQFPLSRPLDPAAPPPSVYMQDQKMFVWIRAPHDSPEQNVVLTFDPEGKLLSRSEYPSEPDWTGERKVSSALAAKMAVINPPLAWALAVPKIFHPADKNMFLKNEIVASLLLSSVTALLTLLLCLKRMETPVRSASWFLVSFALGLSGMLLFLLLQRGSVRIACSNCRKPRRIDREFCSHCRAPFPAPESDGTEVFETVLSNSPA